MLLRLSPFIGAREMVSGRTAAGGQRGAQFLRLPLGAFVGHQDQALVDQFGCARHASRLHEKLGSLERQGEFLGNWETPPMILSMSTADAFVSQRADVFTSTPQVSAVAEVFNATRASSRMNAVWGALSLPPCPKRLAMASA
jgi:hypothetical protein